MALTITSAQTKMAINPANADCNRPITIKDTIYGPTVPPDKHGAKLEVKENDKKSLYYFEQEHHTVWYTFVATCDGTLTFDIIPESVDDDYDFMLFSYDNAKNFCNRIASKEVSPLRTNISRNNKKLKSKTGLSMDAIDEFVHSGPGNAYSKYVEVKNGQRFYLLLDNVYDKGKGHTIVLHYKCNSKPVATATTPTASTGKVTKVDIAKVKVGGSFVLRNIVFVRDSTKLEPESEPELKNLLDIMTNNPSLKIEIQGHVDGVNYVNTPYYQTLSNGRAKAVYQYLIDNKIDATRLKWKGYGSSRKIYEYPQNEAQSKANRRVEIKILAK